MLCVLQDLGLKTHEESPEGPRDIRKPVLSEVKTITCVACTSAGISGLKVSVTQSWPALCYSRHNSPPGSSVHEILQARISEWAAIPFFRGSSWPRDQPQSPALQADSVPSEPSGKSIKDLREINQICNPCSHVPGKKMFFWVLFISFMTLIHWALNK